MNNVEGSADCQTLNKYFQEAIEKSSWRLNKNGESNFV